jgi:WD40 repeat protein/serine/threonine protein kinase
MQSALGLSPGTLLDHFQVVRLVGRGGMGEVYLARDTLLGRKVALKVVQPDRLGNYDAVKRFLYEARVTARFNHPHIVAIYAVSAHEDAPYVALEYLEGQTLRERIETSRAGVKEVVRIGLAIAEALAEAHRHKVLHRDLKPENVIIPKDGRLRVVDFGLARAVLNPLDSAVRPLPPSTPAVTVDPDAMPTSATQPADGDPYQSQGTAVGTPMYMAPEQWLAQPLTDQTDLWALGMILYELISGEHPYGGLPFMQLCGQVCSPNPTPPLPEADSIPPALADLVTRCLDKSAGNRPTTAEAVAILSSLLSRDRSRVDLEAGPFRGLLPFAEEHADLFFGRDGDLAALLERIRSQAVLPIVGPSGAGKSSFVQAGVIPRLREQARWTVLSMRPGRQPFATLAARLSRGETASKGSRSEPPLARQPATGLDELALQLRQSPAVLALKLQEIAQRDQSHVLLFVDQLEELYTLVEDEAERAAFMEAICGGADDAQGPVRVVLTVRDDFLVRLAESALAREVLGRLTMLRSPGRQALLETLTLPLEQAGYRYEDPNLPGEMVDAVASEPACLPLLQFAASELWEKRDLDRRMLLRSAYVAMGGVEGALARHADGVLAGLPSDQVSTAREILLRLVTPERTRRVVPRPVLLEGLTGEPASVLDRLVQERTVVVRKAAAGSDAPEVELVHESLIARWQTLKKWLDESHEELSFVAEIRDAAELWDRRGRRDDEAWHGPALADALRRASQLTTQLPAASREFLRAGERRARRSTLRVRALVIGALLLLSSLATASALAAWAFSGKQAEAEQRERAAVIQRAIEQRDGARSALLRAEGLEARAKLRESFEEHDSLPARALWRNIDSQPVLWSQMLPSAVQNVAFSPDGSRAAASCADGTVALMDVETGAYQPLRAHEGQALSVAFSSDGAVIASAGTDGVMRMWNAGDGAAIREATCRVTNMPTGLGLVPGGRTAIVLDRGGELTICAPGKQPRRLAVTAAGTSRIAVSPEGKSFAAPGPDNSACLYDTDSGRMLRCLGSHKDRVTRLVFSADGKLLLSGARDGTVSAWQVDSGRLLRSWAGQGADLRGLGVGAGGKTVLSWGRDQNLRIWDVETGAELHTVAAEISNVMSLAGHPTRNMAIVAGEEGVVRLLQLRKPDVQLDEQRPDFQQSIDINREAGVVVSAEYGGFLAIWDLATGRVRQRINYRPDKLAMARLSPDGKWIAVAGKLSRVYLRDWAGAERVFAGHGGMIWDADFSPDSSLLVTASMDSTLRIWDIARGETTQVLRGHSAGIRSAAFSTDGKLVASAGMDGTLRVWEAKTGHERRVLSTSDPDVYGVAFSPDGRHIAADGSSGVLEEIDFVSGQTRQFPRHDGGLRWLMYHPGGAKIGVVGETGYAMLRDRGGGQDIALTGHLAGMGVNGIRFSRDGLIAVTGSDDGTVRTWDTLTGHPFWKTAALLPSPARLVTQTGVQPLAPQSKPACPAPVLEALQKHAQHASASPGFLCIATYDNALELWNLREGRLVSSSPVGASRDVLATDNGCLYLSLSGEVHYGPRELCRNASAIGLGTDTLLAACGDEVHTFDMTGTLKGNLRAERGATAVASIGDTVLLGFSNGVIQARDAKREGAAPLYFAHPPSGSVLRILPDPRGIVAASAEDGTVGLWGTADGARLEVSRLHGPASHLLIEGGVLYAASDLGDSRFTDLSTYTKDYCDLMREVWSQVPVGWTDGRAVRKAIPGKHRCAR